MKERRIADIGAADGDSAFFFESLGYEVDVIDHAPTNYNQMQGVRLLARALGSAVSIHDVDLDGSAALPEKTYDLVLFMGILYHLKNPFRALEWLADVGQHAIVSTRIARQTVTGRQLADLPVAYLVNPDETNDDPTNFWMFSDTGLRRLFDRAGWDLLSMITVGDTEQSNPSEPDHDERAFALIRSRTFDPTSAIPHRVRLRDAVRRWPRRIT